MMFIDKMPRLTSTIEGRGNGIKTLLSNCLDVASALHRTPAEVCKFFGCELGAQSRYDETTDRAIVNGAFDTNDMQGHLCKYIELFVLCPKCRLPETKYKYKNSCIFHKCFACGNEASVDMTHKLTTFILKERAASKRSKGKDDEKKAKKKKEKKEKAVDGDDHEEAVKKEKKEKKKKEKKEKGEKKVKKVKEEDKEEEVKWHTDLSEEAVAARMQEAHAIEDAAQSVATADVVATLDNLHVDDHSAMDSATAHVRAYLLNNSEATHAAIVEEVRRQQTYAALPSTARLVIFFHAAFDASVLDQIESRSAILSQVVTTIEEQETLIGVVDEFVTQKFPILEKSYPLLLKTLYDADILEEEALLKWAEPVTRALYSRVELSEEKAIALHTALEPFLMWLKNAEEESESE